MQTEFARRSADDEEKSSRFSRFLVIATVLSITVVTMAGAGREPGEPALAEPVAEDVDASALARAVSDEPPARPAQ